MLWGLIPPWHHSTSPTDHKLTTNNARLEGLQESSRLYKPALEHDRRCVIVCDGFYEWKKMKNGTKQPYLVYANQPVTSPSRKLEENWTEEKGWTGPRPLFMAGLYSLWYSQNDKESPVFNYTVITRHVWHKSAFFGRHGLRQR
jgi:putative SOS response-associated peptidase YedK